SCRMSIAPLPRQAVVVIVLRRHAHIREQEAQPERSLAVATIIEPLAPKGNCGPGVVRCLKAKRCAMLLPWSALIVAVERSGRRRGINRAGAGQSSHRASRLRVGLRLQKSLRATLGGWDAYRPACGNHRRSRGSPCSRPLRSGGVAYERIRKHE